MFFYFRRRGLFCSSCSLCVLGSFLCTFLCSSFRLNCCVVLRFGCPGGFFCCCLFLGHQAFRNVECVFRFVGRGMGRVEFALCFLDRFLGCFHFRYLSRMGFLQLLQFGLLSLHCLLRCGRFFRRFCRHSCFLFTLCLLLLGCNIGIGLDLVCLLCACCCLFCAILRFLVFLLGGCCIFLLLVLLLHSCLFTRLGCFSRFRGLVLLGIFGLLFLLCLHLFSRLYGSVGRCGQFCG